jgi:hypothetical protein
MKTVVLALLVAVLAALFYYPTLVRIPESEQPGPPVKSGNTAPPAAAQQQQTAAPTKLNFPTPAVKNAAPPLEVPPSNGRTVIIVGGGLAGLSAAIGMLAPSLAAPRAHHTTTHYHTYTHIRTHTALLTKSWQRPSTLGLR